MIWLRGSQRTRIATSATDGKGISVSTIHPNLAGQREAYISIQLRAFSFWFTRA